MKIYARVSWKQILVGVGLSLCAACGTMAKPADSSKAPVDATNESCGCLTCTKNSGRAACAPAPCCGLTSESPPQGT